MTQAKDRSPGKERLQMKDIAVLIPVHNHLEYTRQCIETLTTVFNKNSFSQIRLSIVVTDDGSTDGTGDFLRENFPEVHLVEGDGNLWWSGGINAGARYAIEELRSDFLLLWNNDIETDGHYFVELDRIVAGLSSVVIAGSKIYRKEGHDNIIWSYGGIFNPRTGAKYMLGYNHPDSEEFNKAESVDWLPGMGTLVPVEVVKKIGYWDEVTFPQYHGDSDFTYRAKLAGFQNIVYPDLRIWNDTTNTGLSHKGSFRVLIKLLTDIKSNYNLQKNISFYRKYSKGPKAYTSLLRGYYMLFGGFFKWKFLSFFGIKKSS